MLAPLVLAIGGFDPAGGAGLVRDLLTARTLGAAVRLIPTAWTEQGPGGVLQIEPRQPLALRAAIGEGLRAARHHRSGIEANDGEPPIVVVKIGMLPDQRAVEAVADALDGFIGAVVMDPVLAASSGGALFAGDPSALLALGARVTVMTPNAAEAASLTGTDVTDVPQARAAGLLLRSRGVQAVLVKGGHLDAGGDAVDVFAGASGVREFRAPWVEGPPVRGTGCALATAIAVGLGRGNVLEQAIKEAKEWLGAALARPVHVGGEWHLS